MPRKTTQKINETKNWLFETSKTDKPFSQNVQEREERRQIFNVRNETSGITTVLGAIRRTIEKYCEKTVYQLISQVGWNGQIPWNT